jgi:ornithine cyclodeaminase/alanine dehydrogenase
MDSKNRTYKTMKTLLLKQKDVEKLITMSETIESVKEAYMTFNNNMVTQPPIMSIDVPAHKGEIDIKGGYSQKEEIIGIKMAIGYWDNPKNYKLPTGMATICLYDGRNGFPICIMDGTLVTLYRTGAAGGVSAELLARRNSKVVGVIGTGNQAKMQVMAIKEVLPIETVRVWSPTEEKMRKYKREIEDLLNIEVVICNNPSKVVSYSDIVVTTTSSKKPIIMNQWINSGTHIIAIGADMDGKQELDVEIFTRGRVVVDSIQQCINIGETQNSMKSGIIKKEDIYAEIGDILLGRKMGRMKEDEITIFDKTLRTLVTSVMS